MPEVIVNEKDVEWMGTSVSPGIKRKVLALDKETKAHAVLSRYQPGVVFPRHTHRCMEQGYVLEGECEYQGKILGPGTHIIFPAGCEHGPFKVGDKEWVALWIYPGLSGLEEMVPEIKEYLESIGAL